MGKVCFLFLDKCQAIEKEKNVLLKVCKEENNMESFKGTKQTLFNEGSWRKSRDESNLVWETNQCQSY